MIIKKKRKKDDDDNNEKSQKTEVAPQEPVEEADENLFTAFQNITERQERRRGDRRRGYRRVDDRNLVSRAEEEAQIIKEKSAKEGFELGIKHAESQIESLKTAINDLVAAKEEAYKQYESDIAFIALKVAEKVIKTEVACDETIVLNIISEVMKEVGRDESSIIIRTNPTDVELVTSKVPEMFSFGNSRAKILVEQDNNVESGCCVVQTSSGQIDARFNTQLEIMQKAFEAGL